MAQRHTIGGTAHRVSERTPLPHSIVVVTPNLNVWPGCAVVAGYTGLGGGWRILDPDAQLVANPACSPIFSAMWVDRPPSADSHVYSPWFAPLVRQSMYTRHEPPDLIFMLETTRS